MSDVIFCVVIDLQLATYCFSVGWNTCHSVSNANCFKLIQYCNWVFCLKCQRALINFILHTTTWMCLSAKENSHGEYYTCSTPVDKLTTMLTECEERFPFVFMVQLRPKHQNFANLQYHLGLCHQKIRWLWCILSR